MQQTECRGKSPNSRGRFNFTEHTKVLISSVATLLVATVLVAGSALYISYHAALEDKIESLRDEALATSRLIEALHEKGHSKKEILQVLIHTEERPNVLKRELVVGTAKHKSIRFLLRKGRDRYEKEEEPTLDRDLLIPMKNALAGRAGKIFESDYKGHRVLTAFVPVPSMHWGIVTKLDMADVRKPFLVAGREASVGLLIVLLLGILVFYRTGGRLLKKLAQTELDLKTAREKADAANKAKSVFLAHMSHEIRTPLAAIIGFSELLLDPNVSKDDKERFITTIIRSGKHLGTLLDDVLDFSKIEAGEIEIQRVPFNVVQELATVHSALTYRARKKNIELKLTYDSRLPEIITSDATRFRQILFNVIGNAIKFTERGCVSVSFSMDGNLLKILIKDTGPGINSDFHDKIFEPFSQEGAFVLKRYGGTGLGLSISRTMARLLGGDLKLLNSIVGQGSTFEITIDASPFSYRHVSAKGELIAEKSVVHNTSTLSGYSILVVDDAPDGQLLAKIMLESRGAKVTVAESGEKAIEIADQIPFDVILLDINLPGIDGYETARLLRENGFRSPIVALTANATTEGKKWCLERGFDKFVTKPINAATLESLLLQLKNERIENLRAPDSQAAP